MKSDLEISRATPLRPILDLSRELGLADTEIDLYGRHKAKIHLDVLDRIGRAREARYVIVTAMTPTKLGEGKTVTTIGLTQALAHIGERSIAAIRQPSQGPTFGMKGGGAGGGYSQVVPMDELNLHLTGDIHAVGAAHNLLAAAVDGRVYHEERFDDARLAHLHLRRLDIDPATITWKRVVDVDDRSLRHIVIANGSEGGTRETGFDITAASEVMAILALSSDLKDLRQRLGRIVVSMDRAGKPVTAEDLGVAGAMAALLRDAAMPNLMQSVEGVPVLVHAGPFANIAHGNSSILADYMGLRLVGDGYLVTEGGFGADCGFEKFCDIKCRYSGLAPDCAVMVVTVRALKLHGGGPPPGRNGMSGNPGAGTKFLEKGLENLQANLAIIRQFGVPAVVAVNRFPGDTDEEIQMAVEGALRAGAEFACPCDVWARGGEGGAALAHAVVHACDRGSRFRFLYPLDTCIEDKIRTVAESVYGAGDVELTSVARARIERYTALGYGHLPMIMAKTQYSLSHDPRLTGVPGEFTLPVRDVGLSAGAGFLYALCGDIFTMPGLPSRPAFMQVDLDDAGRVVGLS